ncbi:hypothetical protein HZA98_03590 [Candidatus Woesearchaeota archaeon]|nr:hypothetical protein [Candidatus Woesearchaeota archaeon]
MIFEFIAFFVLLFIILGLVYQFMYDSYSIVLILSILFYLGYLTVKLFYYYKKKKEQTGTSYTPMKTNASVAATSMDKSLNTLVTYIKNNLAQGFKDKVIRDALIKQGWPSTQVDQAFAEARK